MLSLFWRGQGSTVEGRVCTWALLILYNLMGLWDLEELLHDFFCRSEDLRWGTRYRELSNQALNSKTCIFGA